MIIPFNTLWGWGRGDVFWFLSSFFVRFSYCYEKNATKLVKILTKDEFFFDFFSFFIKVFIFKIFYSLFFACTNNFKYFCMLNLI